VGDAPLSPLRVSNISQARRSLTERPVDNSDREAAVVKAQGSSQVIAFEQVTARLASRHTQYMEFCIKLLGG